MGWPKKNEQYKLYRDKDGSYLMIQLDKETLYPDGAFSGLANLVEWSKDMKSPCLCDTSISSFYISKNWLKRVQWDEMPKMWREEFRRRWFDVEPKEDPYKIRGFWRVENFNPVE